MGTQGGTGKQALETADRRGLRARLIAAREALPPDRHGLMSAALERHLDALVTRLAPRVLGFCWPYRAEFDCRPIVRRWLAGDATTRRAALAVVTGDGEPLVFRRWSPRSAMVPGRYGIPVPRTGAALRPDLLLMPLVGFDAAGFRLGYGGGYFDRTLGAASPRPVAVGVGFELARLESIAPSAHDVPLDYVVTEAGVKKRYRGRLEPDRGNPG